ncbi:MAG: cytidine deaminase [Clostridia bacterium]
MERISKTNYYLDIAQTVAKRGTCLRRKFGSIIVKNDTIVSTGYAGAPRGRANCSDLQYCQREKMQIPRGERYELCRAVHSEANAIISASRETMLGADLYLVCINPFDDSIVAGTCSCQMCKKLIINAGISRVIVRETIDLYTVYDVNDWVTNDDSLGTIGY